jgi:hypothetical protein
LEKEKIKSALLRELLAKHVFWSFLYFDIKYPVPYLKRKDSRWFARTMASCILRYPKIEI